ncbi:major facilitator superfamily transporter, partial [Plectosphaerella plurivora]
MPILFLAFVFFFLDKANIAFARIHGLEEDLDLGQYEFNIALVVFFVPNFILNIPGNLLLRHIGGGRWLSGLILAWGIVTLSTAFIQDKSGLYVTRIFLGVAESSFLGGALIYLGFFYNQTELISRVGLLYAASPLAGFLGGLLAGGLSRISNPVNGFGSWPWIFLAEGAATIALGAFAFALLPNTPADFMRWKGMAVTAERQSTPVASVEDKSVAKDITLHRQPDDQLSWKLCKRAIFNPMTMIMAAGAFFSIEGIYSYALFLPTIVHTMGFRALTASLMTAPPNFVGFIGTILICKTSRKTGLTGKYLMGCAVTGLVGFILLLVGGRIGYPGQTRTVAVQYTGTFFVSLGVHSLAPLALTWIHINMAPHYVRAIALGFVFTVGNLAPFVASFTYIRSEAPSYT